jgi:hypothetical protein
MGFGEVVPYPRLASRKASLINCWEEEGGTSFRAAVRRDGPVSLEFDSGDIGVREKECSEQGEAALATTFDSPDIVLVIENTGRKIDCGDENEDDLTLPQSPVQQGEAEAAIGAGAVD